MNLSKHPQMVNRKSNRKKHSWLLKAFYFFLSAGALWSYTGKCLIMWCIGIFWHIDWRMDPKKNMFCLADTIKCGEISFYKLRMNGLLTVCLWGQEISYIHCIFMAIPSHWTQNHKAVLKEEFIFRLHHTSKGGMGYNYIWQCTCTSIHCTIQCSLYMYSRSTASYGNVNAVSWL